MADIATNLAAHYPCQDAAASTTVVNLVGANGTLTGAGNTSASSVTGPTDAYPFALQLDGVNDHISLENLSGVGGSDWTLALWIKLDVATPVAGAQTGFGNFGPMVLGNGNHYPFTDGNVYCCAFRHTNNTTANRISFAATGTRTDWHHVAITTTPGANGWKWYHNGSVVHQATGQTVYLDGDLWSVGRTNDGSGANNWLDGAVADIRIYSRALSAVDVAAIYALTTANQPPRSAHLARMRTQ